MGPGLGHQWALLEWSLARTSCILEGNERPCPNSEAQLASVRHVQPGTAGLRLAAVLSAAMSSACISVLLYGMALAAKGDACHVSYVQLMLLWGAACRTVSALC